MSELTYWGVEYSYWGKDDIDMFSRFCEFPYDEHNHPHTFSFKEVFSKQNLQPLEELIFFSCKFYSVCSDPTRTNTTLPGMVDLIKRQDQYVLLYPETFMAPFLLEYSHATSRLMLPILPHPLINTREDYQDAFVTLAHSHEFRRRFYSYMGERAKHTCAVCTLFLTVLMLKCSYQFYDLFYFTFATKKPFCKGPFNGYMTQVMLGCKPGIDDWKRRHAFIHKSYSLMIKTPYFLHTLEKTMHEINLHALISIDEIYFDQLALEFWASVPYSASQKTNPTKAIFQHMINKGFWTQEDADKNRDMYMYAIRMLFHHMLYKSEPAMKKKSFYHLWVDTNALESGFLVVFDRDAFPSPIFVRFSYSMTTAILNIGKQ